MKNPLNCYSFYLSLLLVGCLICPTPAIAADYWLFGTLPKPHDETSAVLQFKFAYLHTWDGSPFWNNDGTSKARAEPKAAVPLRVVSGRFLAKLPANKLSDRIVKLDRKDASAAENEFLVRLWISDGSLPFAQLSPDWRLITARLSFESSPSSPFEVVSTGTVFSSSKADSDPIILASSHPFIVGTKWKAAGARFEYEMSGPITVPPDAKGRLPLTSTLNCHRGSVIHSTLRLPVEVLGKDGVGPSMLGNDLQSDTTFGMKLVSADEWGAQRVWQDASGRKLTATLRHSDGTVVVVEGADRSLLLLDLKTLSDSDQAHVKTMRGR